jgi:hypothetical protein
VTEEREHARFKVSKSSQPDLELNIGAHVTSPVVICWVQKLEWGEESANEGEIDERPQERARLFHPS